MSSGGRKEDLHDAWTDELATDTQAWRQPDRWLCSSGIWSVWLTYEARHLGGAVAGVEAADLGPRLSKDGVVGRNGQVAHHMQDVAAAHGEARHHGDDRLWQPPYLHLRGRMWTVYWPAAPLLVTPQKDSVEQYSGTILCVRARRCFMPEPSGNAVATNTKSDTVVWETGPCP